MYSITNNALMYVGVNDITREHKWVRREHRSRFSSLRRAQSVAAQMSLRYNMETAILNEDKDCIVVERFEGSN